MLNFAVLKPIPSARAPYFCGRNPPVGVIRLGPDLKRGPQSDTNVISRSLPSRLKFSTGFQFWRSQSFEQQYYIHEPSRFAVLFLSSRGIVPAVMNHWFKHRPALRPFGIRARLLPPRSELTAHRSLKGQLRAEADPPNVLHSGVICRNIGVRLGGSGTLGRVPQREARALSSPRIAARD